MNPPEISGTYQLLRLPAVTDLAAGGAAIRRREGSPEAPAPEPDVHQEPAPRKAVPLSFAQQRLWFLDRFEPGSALSNHPATLRLTGHLDPEALGRALSEIVRRHEVLRTRFETVEGKPVQVIRPASAVPLPMLDLSRLGDPQRRAEARRLALDEARRPFDLAQGPVLRVRLLRSTPQEHTLLVTVHHIAFDDGSLEVFLHELAALYPALSAGRSPGLPELPVQYADFATWQRQWPAELRERQLAYWRGELAGLPVLELPGDRPRPAVQSLRATTQPLSLPAQLGRRLPELSAQHGTTLCLTLLSAFQVLLARTSGQSQLAVGLPVDGRDRPELEALVGLFTNTLVLRGDLWDDPSFVEHLARVRERSLAACAHHELPFELLVEELEPERNLSQNPVVQVLFVLRRNPFAPLRELAPGLGLEVAGVATGTALYELTLALEEDGDELRGVLEYNPDLYDATTLRRMADHFRILLAGVASAPQRRLSELPWLSEAEDQQLLREWNDTVTPYRREATIHELFEAQVAKTPEAVAVVFAGSGHGEERVSYGELNRRANRLAHTLRACGGGRNAAAAEVCVGLCVGRSVEMVVGIVGILKSGAAYLPLDPGYPRERLAFMLEDTQAPVLLTQEHLASALPEHRARAVCLDAAREELAAHSTENPVPASAADHLAYLIYTSGSTGRAKGVAIAHRSAVAMIDWAHGAFTREELAGVLATTSICFDLSIFELFVPLSVGGTVILAESALDLPTLPAAAAVSLVNTVPSALRELLRLAALPPSVRTVNLAGEPLGRELVDGAYEHPGVERVLNLYGPSEDTTYSTFAWIERGSAAAPSIGRPVANTRAYVLDRRQRPQPPGVPGELYLGGEGLARCYLARPELTAERFLPDPLSGDPFRGTPGARLYRTGDLVRTLPDGELAFLGRLDHQVKVRGFRIELGEVEAVLVRHPKVREAAVLVREDRPGDPRLVAYAVAQGEPAADELREFLLRTLPEYMVPSAFVLLETMPLGPTGKVDRAALGRRGPEQMSVGADPEFVAPRTPAEELMAGIWSQLLDPTGAASRRLGLHDHFFKLGGHSLLATQLISRIRDLFGVELELHSVFRTPTLAELAERTRRAGQRVATPAIERWSGDRDAAPLSFAQQRLWFLEHFEPGLPLYNIPISLSLEGRLDAQVLAGALNEVLRRHEVLRTSFGIEQDKPIQVIRPHRIRPLPVVDLTGIPERGRRSAAHALSRRQARRPFDLARPPVLRAALLRLAAEEHLLLLVIHHIAFDGWSSGVFLRELAALYQAAAAGGPSPLGELALQYVDFAVWQRQWLAGEVLETQLAYWREELAELPVLDLPSDRPRPAQQGFLGAVEEFTLPAALACGLEELSRQQGSTLFMTLLAALEALVGRYTGQLDLAVAFPVANRNRAELEDLVGFFVNTLVVRGELRGDPSFLELLGRVREAALGAYDHQDLPFEQLVEELQPQRDLSRNPLAQVMLVLQEASMAPPELAPGVAMHLDLVPTGTAKFDLAVILEARADTLLGQIEYSTALFDRLTMRRLAGHFRTLLAEVTAAPERRLSACGLLAPGERQQLLVEWGVFHGPDARVVPDRSTLHGLIEVQGERTPDAVAVVHGDDNLSFGELNARANRLAHQLRALGVGAAGAPETVVGCVAERAPEVVIALLGILKAGGVYLPLDPVSPADRLVFLLRDAGARILLVRESFAGELPPPEQHGARVVVVDQPPAAAGEREAAVDPRSPDPDQLAYLIYTSGTTGVPKAVAVSHRQLLPVHAWFVRYFGLGSHTRVLQNLSPCFDFGVFELMTTLLAG
ncbi:MAG: amino acid adenylation domain-containing protein, partial [bacterium]|nr:amino acid adenylation domain-containing protein [bacterium]